MQRIYIQKGIYEKFKTLFAKKTSQLTAGDQTDPDIDIGPMINEKEAMRVEEWVNEAVVANAVVLAGGKREGAVYQATVLENVGADAKLVCQEAFGPVVSLFPFTNYDSVIKLANAPDYSIHAAIFTSNLTTAMKAARDLDVSGVMINDSTDYRLDAMPFGGAKRGSMGREGVKFAIREMVQTKMVCMNLDL